jgi:hypothetical protein
MTNFLQDSAGTAGIICDVLMVKKDLKRGGGGGAENYLPQETGTSQNAL